MTSTTPWPVGLDVTTKCKLQAADIDRLRAATNPASAFLVRLIELWQNGRPDQYPTLHDPPAVAVTFLPTLVETSSPLTNGMTVLTASDRLPKREVATTKVARQVDARRFVDLFLERLSAAPRGK